jgi:alanyl-tRNA synthetase
LSKLKGSIQIRSFSSSLSPLTTQYNSTEVDQLYSCCGTHYPSLGYLQSLFIFPNTTSIRGTNFRLSFIVGSRVINHLTTASAIVRSSASILGCAAGEVSDRSKIVMNNARDGLKKEKALLEELARLVAKDLASGAFASGKNKVVSYYREEDSTNGLEFLSMLSAELNIHVTNAGNPTCLFNLMATSSPNHPSPTSSIIIFGTESLVQQAAKKLTGIFGDRLKGGGKARWQGKMKDSRIFLDEANRIEEALWSLTLL